MMGQKDKEPKVLTPGAMQAVKLCYHCVSIEKKLSQKKNPCRALAKGGGIFRGVSALFPEPPKSPKIRGGNLSGGGNLRPGTVRDLTKMVPG